MSETSEDVIHTHVLIDVDDLYVVCVKTKDAEVDWVTVLDEIKEKENS
tara:strand:+ start:499 stop:642 length:144 start_codon:yes stop_codon:yes gene_type:complete